MIKHFTDLNKCDAKELRAILTLASKLKKDKNPNKQIELLTHKNLVMIFEKPSTRTRVSFEVAMNHLGGHAVVMHKNDMQLGKGETVEDTAKVLSRYGDAIMIRSNSHDTVLELEKHATVPVINALSGFSHPCQVLASIFTIEENLGKIAGKKLAWCGDANNVLVSYIQGAAILGYELAISTPKEFEFCNNEIKKAKKLGAKISYSADPKKSVKDADVVISDTWFSMGDEAEYNDAMRQRKINFLRPYQVDASLMKLAKKTAIFSHCMPAYRGFEATADVIDSKKSVMFDEAENRLHVQKAILLRALG